MQVRELLIVSALDDPESAFNPIWKKLKWIENLLFVTNGKLPTQTVPGLQHVQELLGNKKALEAGKEEAGDNEAQLPPTHKDLKGSITHMLGTILEAARKVRTPSFFALCSESREGTVAPS